METKNNENYAQDERNFKDNESNNAANRNEAKKEDSDDFHKYDNLSHSQDGIRLDTHDDERIDPAGTDPNRYANLASQDKGSKASLYDNEERHYRTTDQDEASDNEMRRETNSAENHHKEEEVELRKNESNRLKDSDADRKNNASENFFSEGI